MLFSVASIFAQRTTKIVLINETTLQPVSDAKIECDEGSGGIQRFSDVKGEAEWPFPESCDLFITHPDYLPFIVQMKNRTESELKIMLKPTLNSLEEVVVSASRFAEKKRDVAQQIGIINKNDLEYMNQTSSADVMQNQGNVFVQKSQLGGGSPIIRGFETNRVLMVVDGVRMNNAIYRGGHLQNIITLDNSVFEKVEVVFGPGSVVYGSDAMGGVMYFHTKKPLLSGNENMLVKANAFTRYFSAASGFSGHADVSVGGKRFGSLTSFTYSKFGDLRQGANRNPFYPSFGARTFYSERINGVDSMVMNADTNLQIGSAYSQIDVLQKFLFRQSDIVEHQLNLQYSTSSDISRYDRLTALKNGKPRFAEWYYGPQDRLLASYTLTLANKNKLYDRLRILPAYQRIGESRHDRAFGSPILNHRVEQLDIFTFNVDAEKKIAKQELRYGVDFWYNNVNSTATLDDIEADTSGAQSTRYPSGGSSMMSVAAYVTHTWELSKKLILNEGIRVSQVNLNASFDDTTFFPFPYDNVKQSNAALNGNIGLIYMPGAGWRFTVIGSTAFRAPNVDDLGKVFDSKVGETVLVPNPNLKPEYTYNGEVGISKTFGRNLTASAVGYYTLLKNALTVLPATFNGSDSIVYGGQLSGVQMMQNSSQAYIYGIEAGLRGNLTDQLSVVSTVNYTYGRIKTDTTDYPMDHIPPVYGRTSVNLNIKKFRSEFFVVYSGWKRIKDYNMIGEDNFAYATTEGMPAWYTLNLRLGYQITKNVNLQVACENILDMNYRQFASNISAPGRNFILTLRGSF